MFDGNLLHFGQKRERSFHLFIDDIVYFVMHIIVS